MPGNSLRGVGATLALVLATGLWPNLPASASQTLAPTGVVYQCYSYNYSSGFSQYVQAVELKTRSEYLVASSFKGNKLVGKVAVGTYVERGATIRWITGPYGLLHWTAKYHPAVGHPAPGLRPGVDAFLQMFTSKGASAIDCSEPVA